ncbi:hypothetical protein HZB60_00760 [candidate division KSB1 bacterium]|nr:hypothetical protein [candidate division KSB1 bacterium]
MYLRILLLLPSLLIAAGAFAAGTVTVESFVKPPAGYSRIAVKAGSFAASLRQLELVPDTVIMSGDGQLQLCADEKVAATRLTPFDNQIDVGVDGITRLWGNHLWERRGAGAISFPLDNGQIATWKDWRDGLRPRKSGGRFIFVQVTTPDGSYGNYTRFLSFVAEAMGALALRRESTIIVDDSLAVGDILVALRNDGSSSVGLIVDMCKGGPRGERLYLIGTSGTPSTSFYIARPYSPVQGLNEWFTLDGAKWAVGQGARVDTRRVALK